MTQWYKNTTERKSFYDHTTITFEEGNEFKYTGTAYSLKQNMKRHLWKTLQTNKDVFLFYSGGYDSTAILLAYNELLQEYKPEKKNLNVIIISFLCKNGTHLNADTAEFAKVLCEDLNIPYYEQILMFNNSNLTKIYDLYTKVHVPDAAVIAQYVVAQKYMGSKILFGTGHPYFMRKPFEKGKEKNMDNYLVVSTHNLILSHLTGVTPFYLEDKQVYQSFLQKSMMGFSWDNYQNLKGNFYNYFNACHLLKNKVYIEMFPVMGRLATKSTTANINGEWNLMQFNRELYKPYKHIELHEDENVFTSFCLYHYDWIENVNSYVLH